MSLVQVTKPKSLPLTLGDALTVLKMNHSSQNPFIWHAIHAATKSLDGPTGELGRCLMAQQWSYTFDGFTAGGIELPLPPVISVDEVSFIDRDGVSHVLSPASYRVLNLKSDEPAVLLPFIGGRWPETYSGAGSCSVLITCGYGEKQSEIPWDLLMVIGARMATHYQMRESLAPAEFRPFRNIEIDQIVQRYRRRVFA